MKNNYSEKKFYLNNQETSQKIIDSPVIFSTLDFNDNAPNQLNKKVKYGSNYPVVYIINNESEAYVGETNDAFTRAKQHLQNPERCRLTMLNIFGDNTFNTSAILDLESFLIQYMSADNKFVLQNGNGGLRNLNYFNKEQYEIKFERVWEEILLKEGLADHHLQDIKNTDLFKYSPYKSLTKDQYHIVDTILESLQKDIDNNQSSSFVVEGGPGTGKTIVAIYLLKLLIDSLKQNSDENYDGQNAYDDNIYLRFKGQHQLKIGLVVSMENLNKSLKRVFKNIKGIDKHIILTPTEVARAEDQYDVLIIDEAHRLRQRVNLPSGMAFKKFTDINAELGLPMDSTEFDWIMKKSKYQIFMYDRSQSVKPSDVSANTFDFLNKLDDTHRFKLETQLRCLNGGDEYVQFIDSLLGNDRDCDGIKFGNYDFMMFDNLKSMIDLIKEKNKSCGLCRVVAGYAWPFTPKKEINEFLVDGCKLRWNTKLTDWINSTNSIDEIGSIHTVQGFDLNYCGVIIGPELKYDKGKEIIYVDRNEYKDLMGKRGIPNNDDGNKLILEYVTSIYKVLLTRGIKGTYVYVCDKNLRDYLFNKLV